MGVERRKHRRHRKRIKVRFGLEGFERVAFTSDLSFSGLFVAALPAPPLDTRLHLELSMHGAPLIYAEGIVQRIVAVNPGLRQVTQGGFGVRFLTYEELLTGMIPPEAPQLSVRYASKADLEAALPDLRRGGLFLQAQNPPVVNSILSVTMEALWKNASLDLLCRVVHVTPGPGVRGVSLVFTEPVQAVAKIATLAAS